MRNFYYKKGLIFGIFVLFIGASVYPVAGIIDECENIIEKQNQDESEAKYGDSPKQGVDWWPMLHHDQYNTGYSSSTSGPQTNNIKWTFQTDMEAPIPLKQEAVLDQLTQTELEVLTLIEEIGEGSVPEIRKRIEKTREHTARLLKKLYERGFIDRNTSRMPYRYYVRKEIKELIQRQRENMRIAF